MEALALIRSCTGACRVQHLLQAGLPPSHQLSFVTQCSNSLLNAVNAVVGATLNPQQWDIARTPIKLGGLGVHDPYHCVWAARLACLTQLLDHSGELNVDPSVLLPVQQIALKAFRDDISDGTFQVPEDHTMLQAKLTSYGYQRLAAQALRNADQWGKQSLISLSAVQRGQRGVIHGFPCLQKSLDSP